MFLFGFVIFEKRGEFWDYRVVQEKGSIRVQYWRYVRWVDETDPSKIIQILKEALLETVSNVD